MLLAIDKKIDRERLLFGVEAPSYQLLHLMEDPRWHHRMVLMTAAIARRPDPNPCVPATIFCCIFFMVHYWTDGYMTRNEICGPLLSAWNTARQEGSSNELPKVLHKFLEAYPLVREYKERILPGAQSNWATVNTCVRSVSSILELDKDINTAQRLQTFTRGIVKMYEAESITYMQDVEKRDEAAVQGLYDQAKVEFNLCDDDFHYIWALCDQANSLSEHNDKRSLNRAIKICSQGIKRAIEVGQDEEDGVDAEVISDFYKIQSTAYTSRGMAGEALGCTAAAVFCAYMWKDIWEDKGDSYAYTHYEELVERTTDDLSAIASVNEASVNAAAEFIRLFFVARASQPSTKLQTASCDAQRLREIILPAVPRRENVQTDRPKARRLAQISSKQA